MTLMERQARKIPDHFGEVARAMAEAGELRTEAARTAARARLDEIKARAMDGEDPSDEDLDVAQALEWLLNEDEED